MEPVISDRGSAQNVMSPRPFSVGGAMSVTRGPAVSVLVPYRNEVVNLDVYLRSILTQENPAGGFEVIVADGMSEDGTRAMLARIAADDDRVRLVDNVGRIVSTGLNPAIRGAHGSIFARMDAHCVYAPDYLRRCVEALEASGADNVGGPYRTLAEGPAQPGHRGRGPRHAYASVQPQEAGPDKGRSHTASCPWPRAPISVTTIFARRLEHSDPRRRAR